MQTSIALCCCALPHCTDGHATCLLQCGQHQQALDARASRHSSQEQGQQSQRLLQEVDNSMVGIIWL